MFLVQCDLSKNNLNRRDLQVNRIDFIVKNPVNPVHPINKKIVQILTDKHNKVKINIRSKIAQNRKGELK